MKLKIIIHNAIRSVILGLLAALLCYYLWIKPDGGEYTFANYALDAVIYSVIFLYWDFLANGLIFVQKRKKITIIK